MDEFGRQWIRISKSFPNRSDLAVKRRWNEIFRHQRGRLRRDVLREPRRTVERVHKSDTLIPEAEQSAPPPKEFDPLVPDRPHEGVVRTGKVTVRIFVPTKDFTK
jgi:hypothetical protein